MTGPDFAGVVQLLRMAGAEQLYLKYLSPNDNSKNQPYLGGSFQVINVLPLSGDFVTETTSSRKSGGTPGGRMKAGVSFAWVDDSGRCWDAPGAQLILYPQYPEVRFSGFMKGAGWAPRELLRSEERGRDEGRVLFLGISGTGRILGYLAAPESTAARNAHDLALSPAVGVLAEIDVNRILGRSATESILISELRRVHELGWIAGKSLNSDGSVRPCTSSNCGGYTLEAELGVRPNGYGEPDFQGWEIKQHSVGSLEKPASRVVTLFTPNPDGGDYATLDLAGFIRRYGYPDRSGKAHRLNFGGIFRAGQRQDRTGLSLNLKGFSASSPGRFDPSGAVELVNDAGHVAASWSFDKLLQLWARKHGKAAFVLSECAQHDDGTRSYRYGHEVRFGRGAEFPHVLRAFADGALYYDPGIKLIEPPGGSIETKARSQFRMKSDDLRRLYLRWEKLDVRTVNSLPASFWT